MANKLELVATDPSDEVPIQFDLFQTESRALTNTVALWDVAPRGVFRLSADSDGTPSDARIIKRVFEYGDSKFQLSLAPAHFEKDGVEVARYPGEREQLVEEVIRMLASRRKHLVQRGEGEVGVSFTIYEVYRELARTGHHLSYQEIRDSLNVLHMSRVEIVRLDGEGLKTKERVVSGSTFPMLVWADRSSNTSQTVVSFNWLVTQAMKSLSFRQLDYEKLMRMPGPIERWLYRVLAHDTLFHDRDPECRVIKASEIVDGCGVVRRARPRDNYRRVVQALNALQVENIVDSYDVSPINDGPKKVDVEYTIKLAGEFVRSMRRSDQVARQNREDFRLIVGSDPKGWAPTGIEKRDELRRLRNKRSQER